MLFFWPSGVVKENINLRKSLACFLFTVVELLIIHIFKINSLWIFIIGAGKISVLNLYESCQMLLETEEERDHELIRRLKFWLKSVGYYILLIICLMG